MTLDRHNPVPLSIQATRKRWSKDPVFPNAYDALAHDFAALGALVRARQLAEMTQADIAANLGIAEAPVVRLEPSVGSFKHAQ